MSGLETTCGERETYNPRPPRGGAEMITEEFKSCHALEGDQSRLLTTMQADSK